MTETTTEPQTLREAVQQAIGRATMSWQNVAAAGIFDDKAAAATADELLAWIDRYNRENPQLGYATTKHLITELRSRTEMLRYRGPVDADVPEVALTSELSAAFAHIESAHDAAGELDYRTVDG